MEIENSNTQWELTEECGSEAVKRKVLTRNIICVWPVWLELVPTGLLAQKGQ